MVCRSDLGLHLRRSHSKEIITLGITALFGKGALILYRVCDLDVESNRPPGVSARKGGAVLPVMIHVIWVHTAVRQVVLYLLRIK